MGCRFAAAARLVPWLFSPSTHPFSAGFSHLTGPMLICHSEPGSSDFPISFGAKRSSCHLSVFLAS